MANVNLLESYKGRLAVSESYQAKSHNGAELSKNKKLVVAKLVENQNRFMNEAFENSVGTQRSDMGLFRKFALNLTTVAVTNLIAFDLVMVHPMSSMSGYVAYVEYVAGSNKGQTSRDEVFNSPFGLGKVDADYTSARVVENVTEEMAGKGFAAALLESGCFSEMHSSMITIGYKTSAMDDVMMDISKAYEEETDARLQRFVSILEPTLIIILSFFIGLILVSFLLPLLGIMSSIG